MPGSDRVPWLEGTAGDLRHGARVFARRPALTALVVLTLSLGIGANAAIFSVAEAVLLRPVPYVNAERLVWLMDGQTDNRGTTNPTVPEAIDVAAASRQFDHVTYFDTRDFQLLGGDEPERVVGARVEPSLLLMLGAQPALGRVFSAADRTGNPAIVVLSGGLWRRNFGADPAAIGRSLNVNGTTHEIVGVLPDGFSFSYLSQAPVDLYVPYPTSPEYTSRTGEFASVRRVSVLARVKAGASLESASAELSTIASAMAAAHPGQYGGRAGGSPSAFFMLAQPLRESLTRNSRPVLLMLLGAVVLILLIACVNTAQFLLAQAVEREPEVAVRSALGAGRARLVRQFMSEALLLVGAGGLLGVAQSIWLTGALRALVPRGTPLVGDIGLDARVVLFLFAITILTAIGCALVPALRFSDAGVAQRLANRSGGTRRGRLRLLLIAVEVAMSVVLLMGAGVMLRSLMHLQREQGGFTSDRVAVLRIRGIGGGGGLGETYTRYLSQIASLSGVEAAGMTSAVFPGRPGTGFTLAGEPDAGAARKRQMASYQIVSAGYFGALGIPLEAGRLFNDDDTGARPPVAIVNREMAQQFWKSESPIGRQIRAGDGPRARTMTIIGVVGNVRPPFQMGDVPQLYVSYLQQGEPNMALVIRTAPQTPLPLAAVKQAIWSVDPRQAVFGVTTLEQQLAQAMAGQRAITALTGGFAVLALVISLSGLYTVVTYLVSRRFKEIAVRRAVGATATDLVRSLVSPTLRWAAAGLMAGAAAGVGGGRVLTAAVTVVTPVDAALTATVVGIYLLVVLAVLGAASRSALRIDPAAALRAD
jgi:putative ABC transport system permease protein